MCRNNLLEAVHVVDVRLLEEIERSVLTPEARRYTIQRAVELVHQQLAAEPDNLAALRHEVARTRREVENLLRAIETGRGSQAVLDRLTEKEQAAGALTTAIARLEAAPRLSPPDIRRIDRLLAEQLDHLGDTMRGDLVRARQALRTLLVDRVRFTPSTLDDGQRTYRLEAEITLGRVLTAGGCNKVHVPDGI